MILPALLIVAAPMGAFLYASGVRGWRFAAMLTGYVAAGAAVFAVLTFALSQ